MNGNIFGLSPEMMEQARKVGQCYMIDIRKHRSEGRVEVRYVPTNPCPQPDPGTMVDELANKLVWGHHQAFGMRGTIVDIN